MNLEQLSVAQYEADIDNLESRSGVLLGVCATLTVLCFTLIPDNGGNANYIFTTLLPTIFFGISFLFYYLTVIKHPRIRAHGAITSEQMNQALEVLSKTVRRKSRSIKLGHSVLMGGIVVLFITQIITNLYMFNSPKQTISALLIVGTIGIIITIGTHSSHKTQVIRHIHE